MVTSRRWIVFVGSILLLVTLLLWGPWQLTETVAAITRVDVANQWLSSVRANLAYALVVAGVLMVLEAMIPFIPLGPVVAANALLFGLWGGFLVSWLGALLGASACFWLTRMVGYGRIKQWLRVKDSERLERFLAENDFHVLVLGRFLPGVNSFLSYLAGLGPVSFGTFLLSSAVGLLPWIGIYTFASHSLLEVRTLWPWLGLLATFLVVYYVGRKAARALPGPVE